MVLIAVFLSAEFCGHMTKHSFQKQRWNNAICSNTGGPRDSHTEWAKSEKEKSRTACLLCGMEKEIEEEMTQ